MMGPIRYVLVQNTGMEDIMGRIKSLIIIGLSGSGYVNGIDYRFLSDDTIEPYNPDNGPHMEAVIGRSVSVVKNTWAMFLSSDNEVVVGGYNIE
jgi:hypothetical protein